MKKTLFMTVILLLLAVMAISAAAVSISPALDVIADDFSVTFSALTGETVEFSEKQFSQSSGRDGFSEIKVISLPDEKDGILYLFDAPVSENQVIPVSDIRNMKFVPGKDTSDAAFRFTFDDQYSLQCNIVFTDKNNNAPKAKDNTSIKTYEKTVCGGTMTASDADGDSLRYEIVTYPEKGRLEYDAAGTFRYTAGSNIGEDYFVYRAVDENGAYSDNARVSVEIIENTGKTTFSDMKNDTRITAAIAMSDKGVMSYSENNGEKTFSPDKEITRLDFLVSAMNMFGASNIPTVKETGFADDDNIPSEYKGYVYSAAKLGIINGIEKDGDILFCPDKTVTAAEAASILNNVIGYEPESIEVVSPAWASEAVCAMNELGVSLPTDASVSMTKADTAQMLYCVDCLIYE